MTYSTRQEREDREAELYALRMLIGVIAFLVFVFGMAAGAAVVRLGV